MSNGNRKPTDVEMFLPKPVEKNNEKKEAYSRRIPNLYPWHT
jgi:hypothetical protein